MIIKIATTLDYNNITSTATTTTVPIALQPPPKCHSEISYNNLGEAAYWPTINTIHEHNNSYSESSPLCLDALKYTITRNCTDTGWEPQQKPKCEYIQESYEQSNKCPLGYGEFEWRNKMICIRVTSPQPWNNTCLPLGTHKTIFDLDADTRNAIYRYLLNQNITEIWMPAKQLSKYLPIQWQMPGEKNGEIVHFRSINVVLTKMRSYFDGCFALNVTSLGRYGSIENCRRNLPILCVYQELQESLVQLACPDYFYTNRFLGDQNHCYSMHLLKEETSINMIPSKQHHNRISGATENWLKSECKGNLYTLNSVRKTHVFELLAKKLNLNDRDRCLFGVFQNEFITNTIEWSSMVGNVPFVNWATPNGTGSVVTANRYGKWYWTTNSFNCIACEREIVIEQIPEIILNFDESQGTLYLIVYSEKYLWKENVNDPGVKCFTNADYDLIKTVKIEDLLWSGTLSTSDIIVEDNDDADDNDNDVDEDNNKNIDNVNVIFNTSNNMENVYKTIYELKLYGDGPGYYWCSGYAIPSFQLINSQKIVAYRKLKGEVFSMLIDFKCKNFNSNDDGGDDNDENEENSYNNNNNLNSNSDNRFCNKIFESDNHIKDIAKQFKSFLSVLRKQKKKLIRNYSLSIENVRAMKIENIDDRKNIARILFHVTISIDDDDDEFEFDVEEDQLELTSDMLKLFKLRNVLRNLMDSSEFQMSDFKFISLNSTEYCLPDSLTLVENELSWLDAKIGETTAPRELCILSNGLPVLRACVGDFIYGGIWKNLSKQICQDESLLTDITKNLYTINQQYTNINETSNVITNLADIVQNNRNVLIPADLFYISKVLQTVTIFNSLINNPNNNSNNNNINNTTNNNNSNTNNNTIINNNNSNSNNTNSTTTSTIITNNINTSTNDISTASLLLNKTESENILTIYNNLMYLNENTTKISAALNSTNILLESFDNLINVLSVNKSLSSSPTTDSLTILSQSSSSSSSSASSSSSSSFISTNNNNNNNTTEQFQLNEFLDDGIIATITPKLIVYIIDPTIKNISGIALFKNLTKSFNQLADDFSDYYVKILYSNQSTIDLLQQGGLELASYVPQNLLDRLNETHQMNTNLNGTFSGMPPTNNVTSHPDSQQIPVKIVITIYYNDLLFQEYKNVTYAKTGSKIISVSIPGYGPNLPVYLPIFYKISLNETSAIDNSINNIQNTTANNNNNTNGTTYSNTTNGLPIDNFNRSSIYDTQNVCGYWNFKYDSGWYRDGCQYIGHSNHSTSPIIVCGCSHLTHFAYLVLGTYVHTISSEDDVIITNTHQEALDMITLLGCSLSLVGILGITITAIIFRSWREKPSSKVLLQLSAAIALQMILLCFVNTEVITENLVQEQKWLGCVALGASLHYSVLVAFSWMLITAYLQFMRYVRVIGHTRSTRFFLKSFLIGWGVPFIPVLLVVFIDPDSYIPNLEMEYTGICYPTGYTLYLGVIFPIGLIIIANLIIFILVLYNILRGPDGKLRGSNSSERDLTLSQLRLTIFLFFLLGLSWIFGFFASTRAGLVFSYLFCLTATLQGFVLFVYFIILDPVTRHLWESFFLKYCCCRKNINCK